MRFRLFGDIAVGTEDGLRPVRGVRRRRVLAVLLAHPDEHVPVDRLVADCWTGAAPPSAVNSLQSHLSRLRQDVGPDRLVRGAESYRLALAADELDVTRFGLLVDEGCAAAGGGEVSRARHLLGSALELWCGEPFAELAREPFAAGRVAALEERRMVAIEELVEARLELGEHRALCADLEQLTRELPLRERLWEQRMLALYRSGRQGEAVQVLAALRHRLADDLGLDPGPGLARLHEQVLRQDPGLDWHPPRDGAPAEVTAPPLERVLVDLGLAQTALRQPASVATLEAAVAAARTPPTVFAAGMALASAYAIAGRTADAWACYGRTRERLRHRPDLHAAVDVAQAGVELFLRPPVETGPFVARLESRLGEMSGPLAGGAAAVVAAHAVLTDGDLPLAARRAEQATAAWPARPRPHETWQSLPAIVLIATGRYDEAQRLLDRALAGAIGDHHRVREGSAHWVRAWLALHRGDLSAAAAEARGMVAIFGPVPPAQPIQCGMLAEIHAELGDEDSALEYAATALALGPSERVALDLVELRLGRMWLALGRADRALVLLETARANRRRRGQPATAIESVLPPLAVALHREGRSAEAIDVATEAVTRAERVGAPRARGIADAALAEVAGDADAAVRAVARLREIGAWLDLARALLVHAELATGPTGVAARAEAVDIATARGYAAVLLHARCTPQRSRSAHEPRTLEPPARPGRSHRGHGRPADRRPAG